ncbi:similar to Saccharomyces cerevisiae YKL074C MUD2 Protein involved in early pre-mRNA splicing [Maudiozyma saulgeensis]|uniref:Similar to Saccharomyces cerevisiae YKL074C MUD2 Protein involved in early pre-mRNA splicing n=1 Tax=Maudiozyma saulgeensis TaxID=1789683 RepID=A0A1X7QWS9_9SACH|nr:similar to Saccharomyces cerevisiae YKL074C MUD2 Protein involved in early pre-mRNA splicing [Kazachstania saulgeensis]
MGDQKTLEELRAKIMESMGKKDTGIPKEEKVVLPPKRLRSTRAPDHNDRYKRRAYETKSESGSDNRIPQSHPSMERQNDNQSFGPNKGYVQRNNNNNRNNTNNNGYTQQNNYNSNNNGYSNNDRTGGKYRTHYRTDNSRSSRYSNNNNNNSSQNNRYYNNRNSYNNHTNNNNRQQYRQRENTPKQTNAFQKVHLYKNLTQSRLNSTIVISSVEFDNEERTELSFKKLIDTYCKGLGMNFELANFKYNNSLSNVVIEFNSTECSTMVLACRSFLSKKASQQSSGWGRPNSYVLQRDNMTKICNSNAVVIENVELSSASDQDIKELSKNYIKSLGFPSENWEVLPLMYTENDENKSEFTGCILITSSTESPQKYTKTFKNIKWFKPNDSISLHQETKSLVFNNLSKKAAEPHISESRILMLLNCVNPLELNNDPALARDIQECLQLSLPNTESVRVIKPSADYRLTFNYLKEQAGNIYVKFQDIESAKQAVNMFTERKFNGRHVLHTFINEEDYINILQE